MDKFHYTINLQEWKVGSTYYENSPMDDEEVKEEKKTTKLIMLKHRLKKLIKIVRKSLI